MSRRKVKTPTILYEYAILPYANLSVIPLGRQSDFKISKFVVWRDTPENWKRFLEIERPNDQLSRCVDRDGQPLFGNRFVPRSRAFPRAPHNTKFTFPLGGVSGTISFPSPLSRLTGEGKEMVPERPPCM